LTTITKQLVLIMLGCTDVCVPVTFVWDITYSLWNLHLV